MSTIPKEVSGSPLSSEQVQYLEGFFAGIKDRGLAFGDAEPSAGPRAKPERLTPEEAIKRGKPPLDALSDLRAKARTGEAPTKEDVFRFKWNGLFWLAPVHEGYMCRLRLPGGRITAAQFRELASIADELASGYLQLTTRSNVQVRDSLAYDQILEGIEAGRIKGLWVVGTNPAHSWIGRRDFSATLAKLDFLVVQDIYHSTETAQLAHLVLPAAGWGEKEGTLINSERRIRLVKRVARAPGEALSDFRIFRLLAAAWRCGGMFERWKTPEEVFAILQELSEGTPCDLGGIGGYDQLDREGGVQWPFPKTAVAPPAQERRLFEYGRFFMSSGKARFVWDEPAPVPEPTDADYPLVLLTGRGSSAQWHTQTRTGKSSVLRKLAPRENLVEIHPDDARSRGIRSGDAVEVSSRRGSIAIRALVTPTVPRGSVFIPMHEESTNRLTLPVFDPHSRQPSYKHCAVQVSRRS